MDNKNKVLDFLISPTGRIVITVVGMILIYGIIMMALDSNSSFVLGVTLLICTVFGWSALNKITPRIFIWMSLTGWVVYFLIKGLLAVTIGVFVAPFQISKVLAEYINGVLINKR